MKKNFNSLFRTKAIIFVDQKSNNLTYYGHFILWLGMLFYSSLTVGQPSDARVTFTLATNGFLTATFDVQLTDSIGYSEVDVRLIDSIEDSTLYSRSFLFDQTTGLPTGNTWQRQGTNVQLGIGIIPERIAWLGKVRLKTTAGVWSDWYEFLF
jgi:hypothetical protein